MKRTLSLILTPLFLASLSANASACAVCGGSTDQRLVDASNTVLWTLLGLVGFIFVASGATIYFLWRKANQPIPQHLELIESLSTADAAQD